VSTAENPQHLLVDLHLPGYGDIHVRVLSTYGETLTSMMQSAQQHEGGWLSVERDNGSFVDQQWVPMRVNLTHFAMVTQTGTEPAPASSTGSDQP